VNRIELLATDVLLEPLLKKDLPNVLNAQQGLELPIRLLALVPPVV